VRLEFKNFAFISQASKLAAEAALCAGDQGQFWPYHDMLFANQGPLFEEGADSRRGFKQIAATLGLDTKAFNRCLSRREHRQAVQQLLDEGRAQGVNSTPTVIVNGVNLGYPRSFEDVQRVIEEELAKVGQ